VLSLCVKIGKSAPHVLNAFETHIRSIRSRDRIATWRKNLACARSFQRLHQEKWSRKQKCSRCCFLASVAKQSFRVLLCQRLQCFPADYEQRVFNSCFHRHATLVAPFINCTRISLGHILFWATTSPSLSEPHQAGVDLQNA